MTDPVSRPNWAWAITESDGHAARWFRALVQSIIDTINATHATAGSAVQQGSQVVTAGGLQGGGAFGGNVGLALYRAIDSVAVVTALTGMAPGDWAFALDGRKNGEAAGAGTGTPCYWDGVAWRAVDTGATVAA